MATMQQVRIHDVNDVRLDQVQAPVAGDRDVLVRVAACGICGSDLGYIEQGGMLTPPGVPMPLGHEFSGVVEATGSEVTHLAVGQRVVVNPMEAESPIGNGGLEGAFAPLVLVRDAVANGAAVVPIPDCISDEQGALVEPLAVAMHGVNQSGIGPGQSALVMGAGPIGLCAVVVLKYFGIDDIAVVDMSDHRLQLAQQLGAAVTCHAARDDLAEVLKDAHGAVALMGMQLPATDVFIEATGVGAVLAQAIDVAGPGASIAVVGVHKAAVELDPLLLLMKELHLTGSMAYPTEFPLVIEMLKSGAVDVSALVSHRFSLEQFQQALRVARDPRRAAKVLITMN